MSLSFRVTLLLVCCVLAPACQVSRRSGQASDPAPAQGAAHAPLSDEFVMKLAQVESVQASVNPANPAEAVVLIHGLLHDGATRVHEVQQQRLADGFVLTVVTARPRNAVATLALIPFERTVTLSLQGLPPGPCRVVANGVSATLTVP